jgi:glutathione S-transferase
VQPVDRPVFWGIVRTPPAERDMIQIQKDADAAAEVWAIADRLLSTRPFMDGDAFTLADIAVGAYARRWLGVEGITKPKLPHLERWFAQFASRPGFVRFIAPPMT